MRGIWGALVLMLMLVAGGARAEDRSILEGCRDGDGRPVAVREDASLRQLASARREGGALVIATNPGALNGLPPEAASFLYARACVQAARGAVSGGEDAVEAETVDCAAVEAMMKSGLLTSAEAVGAVEARLSAADPTWSRLPGPPRHWGLQACYLRAAHRPAGPTGIVHQPKWTHCVEACGNELWACQHGKLSSEGTCMERYERCSATCDFRSQ